MTLLAGPLGTSPLPASYVWTALRTLFTQGRQGVGRTYAHAVGDPLTEAERALQGWVAGVDVQVYP